MRKIILIVLGLMLSMLIVFANSMAPTSFPGKMGIFVDKASGIELIDEALTIEIDESLSKTHFRVNYTFRNTNEETLERPIMFLSNGYLYSHDFKVCINNKAIKSEAKEIKSSEIKNWEPESKLDYIDPFTDDVFDSDIDRYLGEHILVNEFLLKMDSAEIINVVIEYESWNGYISPRVTDYMKDVKLTSYMLSPATFYEGEATVDIKIIAPLNTILKSNIKLKKKDDKIYEIKDYQLKADEDLHLSFTRKPGISELYAHDKSGFITRFMFLQGLFLIGIIINKNKKVKKILGLILIISCVGYISVASYGTVFNIILFGFFMIPVGIIIAVTYYMKTDDPSNG